MTAILESKYQSKLHVASVTPIIDKIKKLHIITCDICDSREAEYDVFIDDVIEDIPALKRCCDNCIDSI